MASLAAGGPDDEGDGQSFETNNTCVCLDKSIEYLDWVGNLTTTPDIWKQIPSMYLWPDLHSTMMSIMVCAKIRTSLWSVWAELQAPSLGNASSTLRLIQTGARQALYVSVRVSVPVIPRAT